MSFVDIANWIHVRLFYYCRLPHLEQILIILIIERIAKEKIRNSQADKLARRIVDEPINENTESIQQFVLRESSWNDWYLNKRWQIEMNRKMNVSTHF